MDLIFKMGAIFKEIAPILFVWVMNQIDTFRNSPATEEIPHNKQLSSMGSLPVTPAVKD